MIKFILGLLFSALILALPCIFLFSSCSRSGTHIYAEDGKKTNYVINKSSILYDVTTGDNVFSLLLPYARVRGADSKTFVALDWSVGKDNKWVYYREKRQKHVDNETFEIRDGVMRDKNFVYWTTYASDKLLVMEGANPKTFEDMELRFGRDDKYVFYRGEKQPQIDRETFEITRLEGEGFQTEWERIRITDKNNRYLIQDGALLAIPK